jgi:predicted phage gp36 major capsid-like protein
VRAALGTFVIGNLAKTEEALGPRFRPRGQWFGNHAICNKARSFDTSGAADVWLPDLRTGIPDNARGNTGYTLVGYSGNEVSTISGTVAAGNKILCLGDPQHFLIVDRADPSGRTAAPIGNKIDPVAMAPP